jgi:hypothetical protein
MKKIVLSALLLASMSVVTSCKKTYSCECVTTIKGKGTTFSESVTSVNQYTEKMKESQAKSACSVAENEASIKDGLINSEASLVYTSSTFCDIK